MTKSKQPSCFPTSYETALIRKIQMIIKDHIKGDQMSYYFDKGSAPRFQAVAEELAALIGQQGTNNTVHTLVAVAKNVSEFIERWGDLDGQSVGFPFLCGLRGEETFQRHTEEFFPQKDNPFRALNI